MRGRAVEIQLHGLLEIAFGAAPVPVIDPMDMPQRRMGLRQGFIESQRRSCLRFRLWKCLSRAEQSKYAQHNISIGQASMSRGEHGVQAGGFPDVCDCYV